MKRTVRCLIIEDSPDDAFLVKRELEKGGCELFWERVETPETLKDALRVGSWDIIIADYTMPAFNAMAALEIVKSGGHDIPFIIVSGTVGEDVGVTAIRQGASDYIPKDNLRRLVAAVEREIAEFDKRKAARKAEKALRESQKEVARLADLLEHTDQPFGTGFPDGRLGVCNAAFERLTGFSREELKAIDWSRALTPEKWRKAEAKKLGELAATGKPVRYEKEYLRKDGTIVPIELLVHLVRDKDGKPEYYYSFLTDITERKLAELRVSSSLAEKEVLLREIHHRVKNNLQVVISLLNLQAGKVSDRRALAAFRESQDRIRAIALVHEKLYRARELASVDCPEYIRTLSASLLLSSGVGTDRVALKTELEDVRLGIDQAIPCALILNEMLSNCLKHAFPGERKGTINIGLHRRGGMLVELSVGDDGVGLAQDLDPKTSDSMGFQILSILSDQLGGTLEIVRGNGVTFRLAFPQAPVRAGGAV